MKKVAILVLLVFVAAPVLAQEETLLKGKIESGGFGGPVVKFTEIKDEFGLFVGGRGGWIINHTFVIGGGGYGLATQNIEADFVGSDGRRPHLQMGYGGLELEYIHNSNKLVHFSVQALIGAGGATYGNSDSNINDWNNFEDDAFFIAEPGVNVILNVATVFRIGFGAGYRFVSGLDLKGLSDEDLIGPSAVLTFKFGRF